MKLSIPQDALLRAAKHAALAANSKATIPVMACALLRADDGRLTVIGTSHSIATTAVVPCEVESPGAIAVNAADLVKRIATLPTGMVHLTLRDTSLVIQSGNRWHTVPTTEAESFPAVPSHDAEWATVPSAALRDGLSRARPAASLVTSRPAQNGVLVEQGEGTTFAATDGHRLHLARADVKLPGGGILPLASVTAILDVLDDGDIEVAWAKDAVLVRAGALTVRAKLVDAHFPPYRKVIPQRTEYAITIDRSELMSALRAVDPAIDKNSGGVCLAVERDSVQVIAGDGGTESSDVVACEGGPADKVIKLGVNAKYLADALTAVGGDDVTLGLGGNLDPIVVRNGKDESVTAVVMPMMV